MNRIIAAILGLLMLSTAAAAQAQEESWDNLRSLRVGEKIQVVDQKLKSQEGSFVGVSDEAISLRVNQAEVSVQRADLLRVSSREGLSRGKHTLIGLALGAGAGLVWGLAACAQITDQNDCSGSDFAATGGVGALLFGGIGSGIGAMLPTGQPTIYRAKRRQNQNAP